MLADSKNTIKPQVYIWAANGAVLACLSLAAQALMLVDERAWKKV